MRLERIQLVADICQLIDSSSFVYLISYKGLKVDEFEQLRVQLAETGAECHVVKNTFLKKSAEALEMTEFAAQDIKGDTAMVVGTGDCSATAKVLKEASKKLKALDFKIGYMDGKVLSGDDMVNLAELPSIDVMRAMLLGVLQAPATKLVGTLNAKTASIVYALKAYLDKQN